MRISTDIRMVEAVATSTKASGVRPFDDSNVRPLAPLPALVLCKPPPQPRLERGSIASLCSPRAQGGAAQRPRAPCVAERRKFRSRRQNHFQRSHRLASKARKVSKEAERLGGLGSRDLQIMTRDCSRPAPRASRGALTWTEAARASSAPFTSLTQHTICSWVGMRVRVRAPALTPRHASCLFGDGSGRGVSRAPGVRARCGFLTGWFVESWRAAAG